MNSLGRDLVCGEKVIIKASTLLPEYASMEHRIFVCTGGFGMKNQATLGYQGGKLYGYFLEDKTPNLNIEEITGYVYGMQIDKTETLAYQERLAG
jgi:hypothetical protein